MGDVPGVVARSARWCWIVDLLDVRLLNFDQERKLRCVRDDGDQEHLVTCHHEGNAVEAGVPKDVRLAQV